MHQGWVDGRSHNGLIGFLEGWRGWTDGCAGGLDGCKDAWIDAWMGGWKDGGMEGWMEQRMDEVMLGVATYGSLYALRGSHIATWPRACGGGPVCFRAYTASAVNRMISCVWLCKWGDPCFSKPRDSSLGPSC